MSQWVKYQSDVLKDVDKDMFKRSLEEIGLELDEDAKMVSAYGNHDKVDGVIVDKATRTKLNLGVKFEEENGKLNATITGDFWGTGLNQKDFTNQLSQYYQKNRIVDTLTNAGLSVGDVELNSKEELVINASMYA